MSLMVGMGSTVGERRARVVRPLHNAQQITRQVHRGVQFSAEAMHRRSARGRAAAHGAEGRGARLAASASAASANPSTSRRHQQREPNRKGESERRGGFRRKSRKPLRFVLPEAGDVDGIRELRKEIAASVLVKKRGMDTYDFLVPLVCHADGSSEKGHAMDSPRAAHPLFDAGAAGPVQDDLAEYMRFVQAALTAMWAASDARAAGEVAQQFLSSMSLHALDEMRGDPSLRESCVELVRLALKTMKRSRDADRAKRLYEDASKALDFACELRYTDAFSDGKSRTAVSTMLLALDAMRAIASGEDPRKHNSMLMDLLKNVVDEGGELLSTPGVEDDGDDSAIIADVKAIVMEAHILAMKSCNASGMFDKTLKLEQSFSKEEERRMVYGKKKSLTAAEMSFAALVLEAAWKHGRIGVGMKYVRKIFSDAGAEGASNGIGADGMGVSKLNVEAVHGALNILSRAQTREGAILAEKIVVASYERNQHLNKLHRSLVFMACRKNFEVASRIFRLMQDNNEVMNEKHIATLISTAGTAGDGPAAYMYFKELTSSAKRRRNIFTYNATISACGRNKMFDEVEELTESMKADGIAFDACTYASVLQASVVAERYDYYLRMIREIHAKSAARDAILLEESIWIEIIRGCSLSPPSEKLPIDEPEGFDRDRPASFSSSTPARTRQLRRLDSIVRLLESAAKDAKLTRPLTDRWVASSSQTVNPNIEEDELCSMFAQLHARSQNPQHLTGRLANAAIGVYCKLGDAKSAKYLFEAIANLDLNVSAKLVTALFIGLKNNGEVESIVELYNKIWGEDDAETAPPVSGTKRHDGTGGSKFSSQFASSPDLLLLSVVLFAAVSMEDASTSRHAMITLLEMDASFDETAYKHCLHACMLNEDIEHAHVILEMMKKEESLEWDQTMYYMTLSTLMMVGAAEDAASMISHMDENDLFNNGILSGSTGSFHVLALKACLKGGRGDLALSMLRNMQLRGYEILGQHYTITIRALSERGTEGGIATALRLHDEMEESGIPADTFSLNAAIYACSRGGMWREAISYLERFYLADEEVNLEYVPGSLPTSLLTRNVDDQLARIKLGDARMSPDVATFASAIQACGNAGEWRAAMKLFDSMTWNGVKPDLILYNCLIRACGMSPMKLLKYDMNLQARGSTAVNSQSENGDADVLSGSQDAERQAAGTPSDGENRSSANSSYDVDEGDAKVETIEMIVKRIFDDDDGAGVELNDDVAIHVINAFGNLGYLDKAMDWFYNVMTEYGIERTSLVWTVAIGACGMNGDYQRAVALLSEMHESSISERPGARGAVTHDAIRATFNAVRNCSTGNAADGLADTASDLMMERAFNLLQWCEANGYADNDDFAYRMAMLICRQNKNIPEILNLIERVNTRAAEVRGTSDDSGEHDHRIAVSAELLRVAIMSCATCGDLETAIVLLKRYTSGTRNPHSYGRCRKVQVFNAALNACDRVGDAEAAKRVMQDMEMAGVDADKKSYRSMISSCRRKPVQYAQYALDAFERLKWRYEDIVGVDMYALIIEVLWGSRRIRDVFSLLDECEDAQLCSRAWSLASESDEEGERIATIDLRNASADFACARLAHALAGLHGKPVCGLKILTGANLEIDSFEANSVQEAVYTLLQEFKCPLPVLAFGPLDAVDGQEVPHAESDADANGGSLCTHRGEDFERWFKAFDVEACFDKKDAGCGTRSC